MLLCATDCLPPLPCSIPINRYMKPCYMKPDWMLAFDLQYTRIIFPFTLTFAFSSYSCKPIWWTKLCSLMRAYCLSHQAWPRSCDRVTACVPAGGTVRMYKKMWQTAFIIFYYITTAWVIISPQVSSPVCKRVCEQRIDLLNMDV